MPLFPQTALKVEERKREKEREIWNNGVFFQFLYLSFATVREMCRHPLHTLEKVLHSGENVVNHCMGLFLFPIDWKSYFKSLEIILLHSIPHLIILIKWTPLSSISFRWVSDIRKESRGNVHTEPDKNKEGPSQFSWGFVSTRRRFVKLTSARLRWLSISQQYLLFFVDSSSGIYTKTFL